MLQDDLPPRVQRRVTLAREDPALRELPAAGVTLKERQGAEAAGGTADEHAGAAKRGAANVAPKQERGSLQAPQAELRMEDILGEPPMTTQVRWLRATPPLLRCGRASGVHGSPGKHVVIR